MPPHPTPTSARRAEAVQPSVKNVFDRQPLLIPPRPDARAPWYRRPAVVICLVLLGAAMVAAAVRYGADLRHAFTGVLDH